MFVTRTTSALAGSGSVAAGQMTALKGTVGKRDPWPVVTTSVVPEAAGDGAVATELMAKFL
jgi:hypothetical protein